MPNPILNSGCEQKTYEGLPKYILNICNGFQGKRILDLGCGSGRLGEALQEKGNECYGVTISENEVESARSRMTQAVLGDLDLIRELPFPKHFFDVVICADVLEHLKNPRRVLELVKSHLKPQGLVIASIPNVANIAVRLNLLRGRFDYKEYGILDNTHLRFFTLGTAKDLLVSAGYRIQDIQFTNWSYCLPKFLVPLYEWEIKQRMTHLWPGLFATQFIFHATQAVDEKTSCSRS